MPAVKALRSRKRTGRFISGINLRAQEIDFSAVPAVDENAAASPGRRYQRTAAGTGPWPCGWGNQSIAEAATPKHQTRGDAFRSHNAPPSGPVEFLGALKFEPLSIFRSTPGSPWRR